MTERRRRSADATAIPLLDTHVHFWDHEVEGLRWPWLEEGFTSTGHQWTEHAERRAQAGHDAPRFTAPELRQEATGAGIGGVIHAHAAVAVDEPARETRWLARMAEEHGWPNGMIGSCDLAAPDGPETIRRHHEVARCRSVRDMNGPKGLDLDACAASLDTAADLGFSVELRAPHELFHTIVAAADRWPEATFVLSHASLPRQRSLETLEQWRADASELAQRPNAVCKISALAGGSDPDWTVDSIRPWLETCVSVFGPNRAMLATNWPVDRLFGRYVDVVDAYRTILSPLDEAAQQSLFYGTAAALYGVPVGELFTDKQVPLDQ